MRLYSIALLLLYPLAVFKPLITLMEFGLNQEFIATNLCENRNKPVLKCGGKCILMQRLAKQAEKDGQSQSPTKSNKNPLAEEEFHDAVKLSFLPSFQLMSPSPPILWCLSMSGTVYLELECPPPESLS